MGGGKRQEQQQQMQQQQMQQMQQQQMPSTKVVQAKTKAGRRILEKRAPKTIEEAKKAMIFCGHKTNQVVKDILVDVQKLKSSESMKLTHRKHDILPFELGGEVDLERHSVKSDCSLFVIGSHTKKRPNNLVMGRLFDHKLYDMIEFGVFNYKAIREYPASNIPQLGNKPAFIFVGDAFTSDAALKQARSLLLDFFRGRQVDQVNLKGLDRVIFVTHAPKEDGYIPGAVPQPSCTILFRQYAVKYKKSGTRVPKVQLEEMGPHFDLKIRRRKEAPIEMEKEAMKHPKRTQKKVKNVGMDDIDGKVGKIYVPRQDVNDIGYHKMKGEKRERREHAISRKTAKKSDS